MVLCCVCVSIIPYSLYHLNCRLQNFSGGHLFPYSPYLPIAHTHAHTQRQVRAAYVYACINPHLFVVISISNLTSPTIGYQQKLSPNKIQNVPDFSKRLT
uniref:Uncharacterized protein n=1 Tax=Arundo donax TaxID=35708 RepID=A0A0A9DRW3_ARUDO